MQDTAPASAAALLRLEHDARLGRSGLLTTAREARALVSSNLSTLRTADSRRASRRLGGRGRGRRRRRGALRWGGRWRAGAAAARGGPRGARPGAAARASFSRGGRRSQRKALGAVADRALRGKSAILRLAG